VQRFSSPRLKRNDDARNIFYYICLCWLDVHDLFFLFRFRKRRESEREGKRERRQGEQRRRRRCPGLGWAGLLIIFVLLIPPYRSSSR